jgi:RING-variant domain
MSSPCRFCFEGKDAGTLYSPCLCSGTVKYVHDTCLFRWVDSNYSRNSAVRCEICKGPYNIQYNQPKEIEIDRRSMEGNVYINPAIHIIVYCLLLLRNNKLIPVPSYESRHNPNMIVEQNVNNLIWNLFLYHLMYMMACVLYIEITVRNRIQYYLHLISCKFGLVLLIHISVWVYITSLYTVHRNVILMLCTSIQCYLGIYPIIHYMILQEINNKRIRIIMNA